MGPALERGPTPTHVAVQMTGVGTKGIPEASVPHPHPRKTDSALAMAKGKPGRPQIPGKLEGPVLNTS